MVIMELAGIWERDAVQVTPWVVEFAEVEPHGRQPEDKRVPRWLEENGNGGRSFPPRLAVVFYGSA